LNSAGLLNQVWALLANDPTFLGFKGLTPSSTGADKLAYIVKGRQTTDIVTGTSIPINLMYIMPGYFDSSSTRVFISKVVVECYAKDLNTACLMCDQVGKLTQNWTPPGFFVSRFSNDTSKPTGITGVECQQVTFGVSYFVN